MLELHSGNIYFLIKERLKYYRIKRSSRDMQRCKPTIISAMREIPANIIDLVVTSTLCK